MVVHAIVLLLGGKVGGRLLTSSHLTSVLKVSCLYYQKRRGGGGKIERRVAQAAKLFI